MVWSGIYSPILDQPCDICTSMVGVTSKMVEITQGGCVKSVASHAQSNLCVNCEADGWIIFGKAPLNGVITYYNINTGGLTYSK